MSPCWRGRRWLQVRFPRVSGDEPSSASHSGRHSMFFPRVSGDEPLSTLRSPDPTRFPRVSGDEPTLKWALVVWYGFSPRERG